MILNSPYISGSLTVTGNIISSGSITISGSIASASYASNAERVDGLDSTSFVFTSSYNIDSASVSTRVTRIEGNYATTGSNVFMGAQTVCANITSTGTIIAQTLNVQQVTSSIVYSSGSNTFGCLLTDRQQFTGSVTMTGSLAVFTAGTSPEFQVVTGGTVKGNALTDVHQVTGSLRVTGSGNHFIVGGNVGIGTTSPDIIGYGTSGILGILGSPGNPAAIQLGIVGTAAATNTLLGDVNVYGLNGGSTVVARTIIRSSLDGATNSTNMAFFTMNAGTTAERIRITCGGNVGIGTCSPSGQLHIKGASALTNFGDQMLQVESSTSNYSGIVFSGTNGSNAAIRSEGASTMTFWTATGTTYTERMRITSGGCVGIGTTSPDTLLTLDTQIANFSTGTLASLYACKGSTEGAYLQIRATRHSTQSIRRIEFLACDGSSNAANIVLNPAGGCVGIGTFSPTQRLEVCGVGLFTGQSLSGNTQNGVYILDQSIYSLAGGNARPLSIYGQALTFYTGNTYTERMCITSNGNIKLNERIISAFTSNPGNVAGSGTTTLTISQQSGQFQSTYLVSIVGLYVIGGSNQNGFYTGLVTFFTDGSNAQANITALHNNGWNASASATTGGTFTVTFTNNTPYTMSNIAIRALKINATGAD